MYQQQKSQQWFNQTSLLLLLLLLLFSFPSPSSSFFNYKKSGGRVSKARTELYYVENPGLFSFFAPPSLACCLWSLHTDVAWSIFVFKAGKQKEEKRFLPIILISIYLESKVFPKSLLLAPNRHPLICLTLELYHMATPDCQKGNLWVPLGSEQQYLLQFPL